MLRSGLPLGPAGTCRMEKLPTTIEGLAAMIDTHMTGKEDIKGFRAEVNQKFEAVESRLDKIENLLIEEQKPKVENSEERVKRLEDALAV
jgi:hypothetical protein